MGPAIQTIQVQVTTTGSNGSATGSATTETLFGFILDIYFDFDGSAPSSTDTTVAYAGRGGNILVLTNVNTDGLYAPRLNVCDNAGAAVSGLYEPYVLNGALTVSVAQSNALAPAVTAYIRIYRP